MQERIKDNNGIIHYKDLVGWWMLACGSQQIKKFLEICGVLDNEPTTCLWCVIQKRAY